jgi:hypothetical protein
MTTTTTSTSKRQVVHWLSLGVAQMFLCFGKALADSSDDFNDNSKDSSKWGADQTINSGQFNETNQRLEYTVAGGTPEDDVWRPWVLTRFPYDADWTVQFDVFNSTSPSAIVQVNSMGILIQNTVTATNDIYAELYSSALGGLPARTGFSAQLEAGDTNLGGADAQGGNGVTNAAIRVVFASASKVLTVYYDVNVTDGYQWVQQATFGLAGAGGTDANADWGMGAADQFSISLYGYSAFMTITSGQMQVDNFAETGGVTPSGAASPDPIGNFHFGFPTDNPLLTRIFSVTGNYHGVSPTVNQRNYNIDVAQDESGKLTAMGTMDGMLDSSGSPDISGSIGAIKTVNGEPRAEIKGSFKGTRDGVSTAFKGSADGPVEVVDIGGGTNGFAGTGSYKSKIGGVPFSGKNLPIMLAAPPGSTNNVRQAWTLDLDIHHKDIKGKQRTVASARLTLPSGDIIAFPEKKAKYSSKKGYSLSFTRGTNITVNPAHIDKKSKLQLKSLTFTQQGNGWQPAGGTIRYNFLGQRGIADLNDFIGN